MNSLAANPLYKLGSKRRLAHLLGFKRLTLEKIAKSLRQNPANFYSARIKITGGKNRIVEEPLGIIRKIHDRLYDLLKPLEKPRYLFSGQKGISYLDVGSYHIGNTEFLTLDIRKFFASVRREYVFRFFHYQLQNPQDVSWFLADLICFRGRLPLGSPVSQELAFLVFRTLFDKISQKAAERNQKFSLYVDDMTFSSRGKISTGLATEINYYLRRVDLSLHPKRTRLYRPDEHKLVTGMVLTPDQKMKIPNKLRRKIYQSMKGKTWEQISQGREAQTLIGRIQAGRQIESTFYAVTLGRLLKADPLTPASRRSSAGSATFYPET